MDDVGLPFRPGTVSWDVLRRPVFFLGGMNALLLQIAEPRVARGVAEHSDFTSRIFDRLRHTIELMVEIGLGDPSEVSSAIAQMEEAHTGVEGFMADGSRYDAADPELRLWVLATLIATVLDVEETYVGEFDELDRRRYYNESLEVARALGAENAPADLDRFRSYMKSQVEGLVITEEAREIAHHVIYPRMGGTPQIVFAPLRAITSDLLPPDLRSAYGMELHPAQRRWLRRFQSFSRARIPRLPDWIRTFPLLRPIGGIRDRFTRSVDPSLSYRPGLNRRTQGYSPR